MRLKSLRLEKGLTKAAISKGIGTTEENITRWENGEHIPPRDLERLASFLGCTPEYILSIQATLNTKMLLCDLRLQKDLTKAKLAEEIGATPEEIASWESFDPKPIPSEYLLKLADYFQCSPSYIQKLQQNALGQSTTTNAKYKPIACSRCKSRDLAFVTEYHKAIGARILQLVLIFVFALILIPAITNPDGQGPFLLIISIIFLCVTIYIFVTESKTHVQCVCKDCGRIWLHDDPFSS